MAADATSKENGYRLVLPSHSPYVGMETDLYLSSEGVSRWRVEVNVPAEMDSRRIAQFNYRFDDEFHPIHLSYSSHTGRLRMRNSAYA